MSARRRTTIDDKIRRFEELAAAESVGEAAEEIRAALNGTNNVVIAKAAEAAEAHPEPDFTKELTKAFDRLIEDPVRRDKMCLGKTAIASALRAVDGAGTEIFLCGIRHVQMEPAYGGPVDTAVQLRCTCVAGLAENGSPLAWEAFVRSLTDAEWRVRGAAARGLAMLGGERARLLLQLRIYVGDAEPQTYADYFPALTACAGVEAVDVLKEYLKADDGTIRQEAALALGETRTPDAVAILSEQLTRTVDSAEVQSLCTAIALVRSDEAVEALFKTLESGSRAQQLAARAVLDLYRDDGEVRRRLERTDKGK